MKLHQNIVNLSAVAQAFKPLGQDVVFVGGATTALYVDNPKIDEIRATEDVDCVVEVASRIEYFKLEERLRSIGFQNASGPRTPICRWKLGKLIVDIMPTDEAILNFSNKWYPLGFKNRRLQVIPGTAESVLVFPVECFLASKSEALLNRGMSDLVMSQDFQDIVFVVDGRASLSEEIKASALEIREFLTGVAKQLLANEQYEQATLGLFPSINDRERLERVRNFFATSSVL